MKFNYTIQLEVSMDFGAPLLGVDTTPLKRRRINRMAKDLLKECLYNDSHTFEIEREIDEDNLKGKLKVSKRLRGG